MSATLLKIPVRESSTEGQFEFEMHLVPERHLEIGVYKLEDGKPELVSSILRSDPTSLYNVIHGWAVEASDSSAGKLTVSYQNGVVKILYERERDSLRFESRVSSEDFARRVHSLGGPFVL